MRSTESWRQSHSNPLRRAPSFLFNRRVFASLRTINTRTHCRCRTVRIDTCINRVRFVLVSRIWRKTVTANSSLSLYRPLRSLLAEHQKSLIFDSMSGMIRNQCTITITFGKHKSNWISCFCVFEFVYQSVHVLAIAIFCIIFYVIQFVRWWWCLTSGR